MLQSLEVLKRPPYGVAAVAVATLFGVAFLYFDGILFFAPMLIFYLPPGLFQVFAIDSAISVLSGSAIVLSYYQLRNLPSTTNKSAKVGFAGVIAALIAGACPCYYLVPLLAAAGGVGGALGAFVILLNMDQLPIKLASLALLTFVSVTTERGLKASCAMARTSP